jgi:LPS sulfotransferase NodH
MPSPGSNAVFGKQVMRNLSIQFVREHSRFARPGLTFMIDDYNRAIAAYYLGFVHLHQQNGIRSSTGYMAQGAFALARLWHSRSSLY